MAKTKASGTARLGRDSQPKYLGIKISEGQKTNIGQVLIRQRGTKFFAGKNVKKGGDDTLYAMKAGKVKFSTKKVRSFNGSQRLVKVIHVEP